MITHGKVASPQRGMPYDTRRGGRQRVIDPGALDVSTGRSDPTCVVYVAFNLRTPHRSAREILAKTAMSHVDKQRSPV